MIIIIIIKNEKIRVTLCENAAGALYIVNNDDDDGGDVLFSSSYEKGIVITPQKPTQHHQNNQGRAPLSTKILMTPLIFLYQKVKVYVKMIWLRWPKVLSTFSQIP